MLGGFSTRVLLLSAALAIGVSGALAHDETQYPDLHGQWINADAESLDRWDPTKPAGTGQQPPLTPEYQAIWEEALALRASGWKDTSCLPPGTPRSMIAMEPIEFIVMPDTTYFFAAFRSEFRQIFTDGRAWPQQVEPSFAGYSIGKWEQPDSQGRFTLLSVETRGFKGPRTFDASGIPMHKDNETIIWEKIRVDQTNPNLLVNDVTTSDHALVRPWTVTRNYRRVHNADWPEHICAEDNHQVLLGKENYKIGENGYLMPTRKDQPPPDLRFFPKRK